MEPLTYRVRVATGLGIQVTEWGSQHRSTLLILHGGGHDASCWASVCERLADRFRCLVPDARGHGRSEWAADGDYSCASQVADIASLVEQLGLAGCTVAGHSMGGLNALQLTGSHPGEFGGLVLVDVGTETRETGLRHVERKREQGPPPDLGKRYGVQPRPADPRMRDHVPTYCGDTEYRRMLLRNSGCPLLVIRGALSAILPQESAQATAALAGGRVVEIPDAGHNVSLANPAATAAALAEFLSAVAGR